MGKKYDVPVYECSALKGDNVNLCFETIGREILKDIKNKN